MRRGRLGRAPRKGPLAVDLGQRFHRPARGAEHHPDVRDTLERAKDSPCGGTIAHGYFTLSLALRFSYELFNFEGLAFGVNYGLNRVRFPAPMPVGGRVRMRAKLASVEEITGGAQLTTELTFEREGGEKPVCRRVADSHLHRLKRARPLRSAPLPRARRRAPLGVRPRADGGLEAAQRANGRRSARASPAV